MRKRILTIIIVTCCSLIIFKMRIVIMVYLIADGYGGEVFCVSGSTRGKGKASLEILVPPGVVVPLW